jgi:O-methyltransferase
MIRSKIVSFLRHLHKQLRLRILRAVGEDPDFIARQKQWGTPSFEGDALRTYLKNMAWMQEPRFREAYETGFNSGHHYTNQPDLHLEWRIHVILWAAEQALHYPGDFVECGVNTGIFSLSVCKYLDFGKLPRQFYLFDTFSGIPESQMSETERPKRLKENRDFYRDCFDRAQENFAPWSNTRLIRGLVPDTLATVNIQQVAYLSIDMNIAKPEREALEYFWPKLVPGGVVVLDDYGWINYAEQKATIDEFARIKGLNICTLPTGQGIIVKPLASL